MPCLKNGTSELKLAKLEKNVSQRTLNSWTFNLECMNGVLIEKVQAGELHGQTQVMKGALVAFREGLCVRTLSDSLRPRGLQPSDSAVHGILQVRRLECVACPSTGELPDPGIELNLLHFRQSPYSQRHQGNPRKWAWSIKTRVGRFGGCQAALVAQMVKEPARDVGDLGSIPELGRSPGEGRGNPLQYSCLENSMDRGAWGVQSMGSQNVGHH